MEFMFTKLHPEAHVPAYQHEGDAAMDLRALESGELGPGERKLVKTGVAINLHSGHCALVLPRSGLALKHGITVLNSPGLVDEGYRGDIGIILVNHSDNRWSWEAGDRVAQMMILPYQQYLTGLTQELTHSVRGSSGFGSSGQA
jgi:dUTP pyrophosphatase